jgi:hypothetical protein
MSSNVNRCAFLSDLNTALLLSVYFPKIPSGLDSRHEAESLRVMFVILHHGVGRDAERANLSSQRESRLCVPKTSSVDDFGFDPENSLFLNQNSLFRRNNSLFC